MRRTKRFDLTFISLIFALFFVANCCCANTWDEVLEGTLPLPLNYALEVVSPDSGVVSTTADTGEGILRLTDSDTSGRPGRINRGNWENASGVTLHARIRFGQSDNRVMGFQLNDGYSNGRLAWKWENGSLVITTGTPDAYQPYAVSMPVNTWAEIWIYISGGRYTFYKLTNGTWKLISRGATAPVGTGGVVYLGSSSDAGVGSMDVDFWRLETTHAHYPGDPTSPCIPPQIVLPLGVSQSVVTAGQSTSITVGLSQSGYKYQLCKFPTNMPLGNPVPGNGGTISLPTGPLTSTTSFSVLAASASNPTCSTNLVGTPIVYVSTPVASVAEAKAYPDGTVVTLSDRVVSAVGPGVYWIQDGKNGAGIAVPSQSLPQPGVLATVTGELNSWGERRIAVIREEFTPADDAPRAVGMRGAFIGGVGLNEFTPGVIGGIGPNNVGKYVRVWGRVTAIGDGFYYIDDGSDLRDGTSTGDEPNVGVRVLAEPIDYSVGDSVVLSSVVTCFVGPDSKLYPAVIPVLGGCDPPRTDLVVTTVDEIVCVGGATSIAVANSEVGVEYQLRKVSGSLDIGAPVPGTGGTIYLATGPVTELTTYSIIARNIATQCAAMLSARAAVDVYALPAGDLGVAASPRVVISGQSTNINILLSQTGISYQLRNGEITVGSPVIGTGSTISLNTGVLTADTVLNVLATNASGCSVQLDQSAAVTVEPPGTVHSKVGVHVVGGPRGLPDYSFQQFLQECSDAGHPVAVVKCLDDFGAANEAKQVNPATLTMGRLNDIRDASGNVIDLQGMDQYVGQPPAQVAAWVYSLVKPKWQQNPQIDVWEIFNEWSWHYGWQADFQIAMMDLAEQDGFRIALYGCSGGNPPEAFWPDIARACARAKAHGGHMLSLHEYSWDGLLMESYQQHGDDVVLRYRRLYNYLKPLNADCPLVLTEVGQNGGGSFCGIAPFIQDYTWYDSELKKDPYVIGCTAWILGDSGWGGASFVEALPALADYISTH